MKLLDAVGLYIARRRLEGAPFVSTDAILRSLCKFCGDIDLRDLTADRIARFLNTPKCAAVTRVSRYSAVKCFADYCSVRNQLPKFPLQKPAAPKAPRTPYIYTRSQLHTLLNSARKRNCKRDSLDGETLRMILLTMYATGATSDEVLGLRRSDLDFNAKYLTFCGTLSKQRSVPIGADLKHVLSEYVSSKDHTMHDGELLFSCKDGRPIIRTNLWYHFVKLHKTAGLSNTAAGNAPRLHDLKFTFAVHRLSCCIQRGEKHSDLVPALSTYMGYTSLTKAERYLEYVPERFTDDLRKLSPGKPCRHWRDVPGLLHYLISL